MPESILPVTPSPEPIPHQTVSKTVTTWLLRIVQILSGRSAQASHPTQETDIFIEVQKIKDLSAQALSGETRSEEKSEATQKLLTMVGTLQERLKTASPKDRQDINEAIIYANLHLQEIFERQLSKPDLEGGEPIPLDPSQYNAEDRVQENYGKTLASVILATANGNKQKIISKFAEQITELYVSSQKNEHEKRITLLGMMKVFDTALNDELATELIFVLNLTRYALSDEPSKQEVFVSLAKDRPRTAMLALATINSRFPKGLEQIAATVERSDWEEGKKLLKILMAANRFQQNAVDPSLDRELNELAKTLSPKDRELFKEPLELLTKSMVGYWERERARNPEHPSVEFIYKSGLEQGEKLFKIMAAVQKFQQDAIEPPFESELRELAKSLSPKEQELFKAPLELLANSMLDYCERERIRTPEHPSIEFIYKSCTVCFRMCSFGEGLLDELMKQRPQLREWLQSDAAIQPGFAETFQAPSPPIDPDIGKVLGTILDHCPDEKKPLVTEWSGYFRMPGDVTADLMRNGTHFITPTKQKITTVQLKEEMDKTQPEDKRTDQQVVSEFAQRIYDSFPEEKKTPAMKEAIGKLCAASTQGFFPATVYSQWSGVVKTLTQKEWVFIGLSERYTSKSVPQEARFTIDQQTGGCTFEYPREFCLMGVTSKGEPEIRDVILVLSKIEAKSGEENLTYTFQPLSTRPFKAPQ
jgi:hypothetical protein